MTATTTMRTSTTRRRSKSTTWTTTTRRKSMAKVCIEYLNFPPKKTKANYCYCLFQRTTMSWTVTRRTRRRTRATIRKDCVVQPNAGREEEQQPTQQQQQQQKQNPPLTPPPTPQPTTHPFTTTTSFVDEDRCRLPPNQMTRIINGNNKNIIIQLNPDEHHHPQQRSRRRPPPPSPTTAKKSARRRTGTINPVAIQFASIKLIRFSARSAVHRVMITLSPRQQAAAAVA